MILKYTDGSLRIVVPAADLNRLCWEKRVSIVWISDQLPTLKDSAEPGESITNFKADLLDYLLAYDKEILTPWIESIKKVDFSNVKVGFVGSVPGQFLKTENEENIKFGHPKIKRLLAQYSAPIEYPFDYPVVAQCCTVGGCHRRNYFRKEAGVSFCADLSNSYPKIVPELKLIYTSANNVNSAFSNEDFYTTHSLWSFYDDKTLNSFCQWKSTSDQKERALPKMRSTLRFCDNGIYWFMMGSHNITARSMGPYFSHETNKLEDELNIFKYDVSIMFFPKLMVRYLKFFKRLIFIYTYS